MSLAALLQTMETGSLGSPGQARLIRQGRFSWVSPCFSNLFSAQQPGWSTCERAVSGLWRFGYSVFFSVYLNGPGMRAMPVLVYSPVLKENGNE